MELKSKISTSIEQSKKLLEFGLKPETADMAWGKNDIPTRPFCLITRPYATFKEPFRSNNMLPSWSLSRLIELMPDEIEARRENFWLQFSIENNGVSYKSRDRDYLNISYDDTNNDNDIFENFVNMIDYLIRKNYFNKEYLNK